MSEPHLLIVPILKEVGFSGVANLRHLKVDHALVTILVESWKPETHSSRCPTRECTITLEDVALQLGLRVDGLLVIGPTLYDWEDMCFTHLRIVPVKGESLISFVIKLKWLRENMLELPEEPSQEELHAHCRAYILGLIGGVLMPDKTDNKVHLMYLSLLIYLRRTRQYSWGSSCLAMLYREMCRAIDVTSKTMGGCASLLQSWAWHRMPYIAPISKVPPTFPLFCKWSGGRVLNFQSVPHNDVVGYRSRFDHIHAD
uniref:Serine/threonine protein phosphatase 7 long form isogeny n=2 Tax=Cajanus cajan TaxID=3821 RepID=A0A151T1I5_CAJCA|nr:Serine/threonine protein phosphatase 7 long form isogeny [Cajanus cajan]